MGEMQADAAAARTARDMSLAEKARAEVEAMQAAQTARNDPALATEYAAHASGIDMPAASRLTDAIRGKLEQPSQADIDDADMAGSVAKPFPTERPVLGPGQERAFRSALAATIANRVATGKTNAEQLAHSGDRIAGTSMSTEAGETEDVPSANRLIAAVSGRARAPFRAGSQGQVVNTETGDVDETTGLAQAARALSGARTATEGSRQGRNRAQASLSDARRAAVERGATDKGGKRIAPEQLEKWASEAARKEWEAIPARERKGMNYEQHLQRVRDRFIGAANGAGGGLEQDAKDALEAINKGAPSKAVHARFEKRWGKKLIDVAKDPTDDGLGAGENALDEDD